MVRSARFFRMLKFLSAIGAANRTFITIFTFVVCGRLFTDLDGHVTNFLAWSSDLNIPLGFHFSLYSKYVFPL